MRGYVLCGGASRRMGRDKALMPHPAGDGTLLDHAAALAGGLCDEVILLSGDGARYPELGLRELADALPAAGPLGGILAALAETAGRQNPAEPKERAGALTASGFRIPQEQAPSSALFLPVDLPHLQSLSLARLFDAFHGKQPAAAVAAAADGWHPVLSIWHAPRCLPALRRACQDGNFSAQGLLHLLDALPVTLPLAELDNWNEAR